MYIYIHTYREIKRKRETEKRETEFTKKIMTVSCISQSSGK